MRASLGPACSLENTVDSHANFEAPSPALETAGSLSGYYPTLLLAAAPSSSSSSQQPAA
eukprot:CAMPEP_0171074462 /NCGR_PEP_ID=MMETSP0766_2-20121228/12159_1 /TAXON_ID=439317 /ORGANISM="Gambierdiscus australes, Strain CAWD 149" /LENGTH=58 /DNA_ID=CAMNT_0011531251 /DNA_START=43 /DNA_END=215 /DNA_ORIENTATION=-